MLIVKVCRIHGNLSSEQVNFNGKKRDGSISLKCKACAKKTKALHYERNKEKIKQKHLAYIAKDPEKHREMKRKSCRKYAYKYGTLYKLKKWAKEHPELFKEKDKNRYERRIINLSDNYIKGLIVKRNKIKRDQIPKEIVDLKRTTIAIRRMRLDILRHQRLNPEGEKNVHRSSN